MTIEEIESACDASLPLDFSRHPHEGPELALRGLYYPYGFPAEVRTNSAQILSQFGAIWGGFQQRCNTEPIQIDVHVVETDSMECPRYQHSAGCSRCWCLRLMRTITASWTPARIGYR